MIKKKKSAKKVIRKMLNAVFFLTAIAILMYPLIANKINDMRLGTTMKTYTMTSDTMTAEEKQAAFEEASQFNKDIPRNSSRWKMDGVELERYLNILNVGGDEIIGEINIPAADVKLPIFHTAKESVLQKGAGHMTGSSFPIGEPGEHAVITGHRGLTSAKLFTNIDVLEVGDGFQISVLDRVMTYRIDQILTVLPTEMEALDIEDGKTYCTLITCTPYGINSHRLLIRGALESVQTVDKDGVVETIVQTNKKPIIPGAEIMFGLAIILLIVKAVEIVRSHNKKKKKKVEALVNESKKDF